MLVWCDMETDGGGWTVFLSRQKQTQQLDFNRTWSDYKEGFGNPYKEYYLGGCSRDSKHQIILCLQNHILGRVSFIYECVFFLKCFPGNDLLHQMTYSRAYAVRLDVELVSGGYDFATYESFRVNSEDKRYTLAGSYIRLTLSLYINHKM